MVDFDISKCVQKINAKAIYSLQSVSLPYLWFLRQPIQPWVEEYFFKKEIPQSF